jgi:type II secretory pathway pseudopilin PulG
MKTRSLQSAARAVALLEIVLALALFFGVAMAVLGGLSAAIRSARQVRSEAVATDLAVTLLSEIRMGLVGLEDAGPTPYEDEALAAWAWEVVVTPVTADLTTGIELSRVEIIIRNANENLTRRLYHLIAEAAPEATAAEGAP